MATGSVHRPVLMLTWARWDPLAEESVWECASNRGRSRQGLVCRRGKGLLVLLPLDQLWEGSVAAPVAVSGRWRCVSPC